MSSILPLPHAIALTGRELLMAENHRLKAKSESQRAQINELRRKLTESEERCAHSNALLRRTTRLLDQVVYSQQNSSEVIEEVEQMRYALPWIGESDEYTTTKDSDQPQSSGGDL